MKELKLARFQPSVETSSARWSNDGSIAIACGSEIVIAIPSVTLDTIPPQCNYSTTTTVPWTSFPHPLSLLEKEDDQEYSVAASVLDRFVSYTDLAWSPTSPTGCTLAALTDSGEVYLFGANGNESQNKWIVTHSVTQALIDHLLGDTIAATHDLVCQLTAHSIAWSCRIGVHASLLAVGNSLGSVFVFVVSQGQLNLLGQFDVDKNPVSWLEWSPVSTHSNIVLSAATSQNAVHLATFSWDIDSPDSSIKICQPFQLTVPSSKYYLSSMAWGGSDARVLALQYTDSLRVVVLKDSNAQLLKAVPSAYIEATAGMAVAATSNLNQVDISMVSTRGNAHSVVVDIETGAIEPSDTCRAVNARLAKKIKAYSVNTGYPSAASCSALLLHPHGSYMAIVYNLHVLDQLRYPLISEIVSRIMFIVPPYSSSYRIQAPNVANETAVSTWLELATFVAHTPSASRQEYIQSICTRLESELEELPLATDILPSTLQEAFNSQLWNPQTDQYRLLQHVIKFNNAGFTETRIDKYILTRIALATLASVDKNASLSDADRAVLISYNCLLPELDSDLAYNDSNTCITIKGGFFEESFDFSHSPTTNLDYIHSQTNHEWKRCSLTLLPLTTPNLMTCSGCGLKRLAESPGGSQDTVVSLILRLVDNCPYCGCHYSRRGAIH